MFKINKLVGMILIFTHKREINRTTLNKLLFFAELLHFLRHGKLISDDVYLKKPYGPVPQHIDAVRNALIRNDYLTENTYESPFYYEYCYIASDNIDMKSVNIFFTAQELECVNEVSQKLASRTAKDLSETSHKFEPWKSAGWDDELLFKKAIKDIKLNAWINKTFSK